MGSHEADLFSRYESEVSHDLAAWRRNILDMHDHSLKLATQIEQSRSDHDLKMNDPIVVQSIGSRMRELILDEWKVLDHAPLEGDLISVTGSSLWHVFDGIDAEFSTEALLEGQELYGIMEGCDIYPYVDDSILDAADESDRELDAEPYRREFGLHLILHDPFLIDEQGVFQPLDAKRIYLPVHYEQARLRLYANL